MGQICKSGVKEMILEYSGIVSEMNVAPLTVSALKGYLSPIMSAPVTYVNAPLIAEERGIKLREAKITSEGNFSSLVTLIVKSETGEFAISGSIFGTKQPRFTKLNEHIIDVIPDGNVLIIENDDKPGVIGLLGNALGKQGKFSEAIDSYQRAIKIKPSFTEAYNNLGLVFEELGKFNEAIDSYQQAIKIKPNFTEAYNNLGNSYDEIEISKISDKVLDQSEKQ